MSTEDKNQVAQCTGGGNGGVFAFWNVLGSQIKNFTFEINRGTLVKIPFR